MGVFACCSCTAQVAAFITQASWGVDLANGNDANAGTPAEPLATIAELERRLNGGIFAPSVNTLSITIAGDFSLSPPLTLDFEMTAPGASFDIRGTMTSVHDGSLTGYQAFVHPGTRALLTDAAYNFTPTKLGRIRATSGAALNGIAFYASINGVNGANVSQFFTSAGLTGTLVNPAIGDTYSIETFNALLSGYDIRIGGARGVLRDFEFLTPAAAFSSSISRQADNIGLKVFGCRFQVDGTLHDITGPQVMLSCEGAGAGTIQTLGGTGFMSWKGWLHTASTPLTHATGSNIQATGTNMHDGDGARNSCLKIIDNSELADVASRVMLGVVNGAQTALVRINGNFWYIEGAAQIWGATGNTTTNACQILNASGASYDIKPTITGNTPGVNDVVISGGGMAWAAVPFAAAAPNNGFFNTRV